MIDLDVIALVDCSVWLQLLSLVITCYMIGIVN